MKPRLCSPYPNFTAWRSSALGAALLAAVGCANQTSEEQPVTVEPATLPAATDVRLIDAPSIPEIVLRWKSERDGSTALESLDFSVENTTDREIEVELQVVTQDGVTPVSMLPQRVQVGGGAAVEQSVPVDQLAAQLEGESLGTQLFALYSDAQGVRRSVSLEPIWVAHEPGFGSAFIRTASAEANHNAALGLRKLREAGNRVARVLDGAVRQPVALPEGVAATTQGRTHLVMQSSELPDPRTQTVTETQESSGLLQKGGNFNLCFWVPYWYIDTAWGEDYLNANTLNAAANTQAKYMTAILVDTAGNFLIRSLNDIGCTGTISLGDGNLTVGVTSQVARSGVIIEATTDSTKQFQWTTQNITISGSGRTMQLFLSSPTSPLNAAIASGQALGRAPSAFVAGTTSIFTDETCPRSPGSGCQEDNKIFLGFDPNGLNWAVYKFVVLHELGHQVQRNLFGMSSAKYVKDANLPDSCRCDHVAEPLRQHCLQGRMDTTSAQVEGFGHFFAADALNQPTESNCTFVNYKQFRNDNGSVTQPPIGKSCLAQTRWMANHCDAAGQGTEFDWLGFYWSLHNKTANQFSYADIRNVYTRACGGSCLNMLIPWGALQNAANVQFGANSAKAAYWAQTGANFGVNR